MEQTQCLQHNKKKLCHIKNIWHIGKKNEKYLAFICRTYFFDHVMPLKLQRLFFLIMDQNLHNGTNNNIIGSIDGGQIK